MATLAFAMTFTFAWGSQMTIQVYQSDGATAFQGVTVSYHAGYWKSFGTTNASGQAVKDIPDGTYQFKVSYDGTDAVLSFTVSGTSSGTFYSSKATIHTMTSASANLPGVAISFLSGYWRGVGSTDASGLKVIERFPGTFNFKAELNGTSAQQSVTIPGDGSSSGQSVSANFYTSLAEMYVKQSDGSTPVQNASMSFLSGYWRGLGSTDASGYRGAELFPGAFDFKAELNGTAAQQNKTISGDGISPGSKTKVTFHTSAANIYALQHNYNPFQGVSVSFLSGYWRGLGQTDAAGLRSVELFPGAFDFKVEYGGTDAVQNVTIPGDGVAPGSSVNNTFYSTEVTFKVEGCDTSPGTPVAGASCAYLSGYWRGVGSTDANGEVKMQRFGGLHDFRAEIGGTQAFIYAEYIPGGHGIHPNIKKTFTFNPTKVSFTYSGSVKYFSGYWRSIPSHGYLFPGTYQFKFNSKEVAVNISGCSYNQFVNTIKVKDHQGNPIAGATARGGYGSNYSTWHVSGSTDANGLLLDFRPASASGYSYEARVNNTTAVAGPLNTGLFEFQTQLITMRLETCNGSPLDGAAIRYGTGSTYTSWWFPGGNTGSSASGESTAEFFPGTYSFEAQYQGTSDQKISFNFPSDGTTVTWQTTKVTLHWPGQISFGGSTGDSRFFNKPSMELLPGTYKFHFRTGYRTDLTFSGCNFEKTGAFAQLKDSNGNGLANASFKYRFGWGSYTDIGTDNTGNGLFFLLDGNPGNTKVTCAYLGASVEKEQNVQTNPLFIFNTVNVTADLKDSNGNTLTASSWDYRYGWGAYATFTNTGMELLPVNVKVLVGYKGASVEKEQNAGTSPYFLFNTVNVTADLKDSNGNTLTASSWDYRYGWGAYATLNNAGEELLPVNVKVLVGYKGATVEKEQNVGASPYFLFNTVNVTADIQDANGNSLMATGWDYRYGWGSYSPLTIAGEELLPVAVKVRVTFKGATMEKEQNVGTSPYFLFNTVNVTADLKDGSGNLLTADNWQYRYGWGGFTNLNNAGEELLPLNTKVKVTYTDPITSVTHTWEKEQNVGSNSYFLFTYDGTKIRELSGEVLEDYSALEVQVRPNPVWGSALIDLAIPKDGHTQAAIYDLNGKLIHVLYDGEMKAGSYTFEWDAGGLTAGTYFCRLVNDKEMKTLRILLVD
ncbi:MAG: T9SS type A sorting domain-containing protein [Saprospiraceae bacterium]